MGVLAVWVAATLIRGVLGFGNALVAMPLLALFLPTEVVTPLVAMTAMVMVAIMLAQSWRGICLRSAMHLIAGSVPGIPLGLLFLKQLPTPVIQLVLAVVVFVFSLYKLYRPKLFHLDSDRWAWVAGFAAGILGGAYNTNGPPVVIYGAMRGWGPERFRATLQGFFFPVGIMILLGHYLAGLWTPEVFHYALPSIPVVVVCTLAGRSLARRIPAARFEKLVHFMLMATAISLALKAIL